MSLNISSCGKNENNEFNVLYCEQENKPGIQKCLIDTLIIHKGIGR